MPFYIIVCIIVWKMNKIVLLLTVVQKIVYIDSSKSIDSFIFTLFVPYYYYQRRFILEESLNRICQHCFFIEPYITLPLN